MPRVEVFEGEADKPLFVADFDFLPRAGEYLSEDAGGHFEYFEIIEVWHRQDQNPDPFKACLSVRLAIRPYSGTLS